MKVLITSLMVLCTVVVFGQKQAVKKVAVKSEVQLRTVIPTEKEVHGVVVVDENSPCKVMLEVFVNNETVRLYPLNLASEFQKNGLDIYFKYTVSNDPMIQACGIVEPVNVSDVRLARP